MAGVKTTIKPYKLKPSGDNLSRDDLATWQQVLLSHMRQNDNWKPFLPGGGKQNWVAADSGEENVLKYCNKPMNTQLGWPNIR